MQNVFSYLTSSHTASGFQRHTSVSLNNNITLRASPPPIEPDPVWEQPDIFQQLGFDEGKNDDY